jgi:2-iminobutanoate/2-iminopropanoate deaminase
VHALPALEQSHESRLDMLSAVSTGSAPKALGPYSQGIRAGQFMFVSGQVPIDPQTGDLVQGSIGDQTRRVFQNIGEILKAGGASFQHVVRTTVYLADLGDFSAMNDVYATFFTPPQPARSTIEAARLPRDARIEVDVIAFLG